MGTEDDQLIIQKIFNGVLEKTYGSPINWAVLEKTELEKSVWLNRFYYLPSFARLYYLKKDKSSLEFMMQFIRKWIKENPRDGERKISRYNWYDMQVAWRAIHLSWCYFLAEKELTEDDKALIFYTLEEHSSLLLSGFGQQKLNEFNHQSHGALAMLYLGTLFPSLADSPKLVEAALKILDHHIENAFYADGGNVEQMFGYYPFEAHIFRDAYLLCKANGIELPHGIMDLLKKLLNYLQNMAQPDGTMPPVNDSFPMPVATIITTLTDIIGGTEGIKSPVSQYFPETQIGVMRSTDPYKNWYILLNPASIIGSHAHAGRLAFTLWYNNQPLFIDSGCCNYDNPKLVEWYRTSLAHNTVLIDELSDEDTSSSKQWASRRQTENRITEWIEDPLFTFCRMVSPASEKVNSMVTWERNIAIVKNNYAIIYDHFIAAESHSYEIVFHMPPLDTETDQSNKRILIKSESPVALIPATPEIYGEVNMVNNFIAMGGMDTISPVATYRLTGADAHSLFVVAPVNESASGLKVIQEVYDDGVGLIIEHSSGETDTILFRNTGAGVFHFGDYKTSAGMAVYSEKK